MKTITNQVVELIRSGHTQVSAAIALDVSLYKVKEIVKRKGMARPRFTNAQAEEIVCLKSKGYKRSQIVAQIGCSLSTVGLYLRKYRNKNPGKAPSV